MENTATILNEEFIGECNVCYKQLPLRANHVFTECGHLFCVKCLLIWDIQSSTCPVCRKPLYEKDDIAMDEIPADQEGYHFDGVYDGWDEHRDNQYNRDGAYGSSEHDDYTDDSGDDGRFDTIDDYLVDDINWSGIIEEDDLHIPVSENVLCDITNMRKNVEDIIRYQTYTSCLFSAIEFNGEITYNFIKRDEYSHGHPYLNNNGFSSEYNYEIILKQQIEDRYDSHYFAKITEKKIINVPAGEWPGGCERYTLEYAYVVDLIDTYDHNNEIVIYKRNHVVLFRDIRRMYLICPRLLIPV